VNSSPASKHRHWFWLLAGLVLVAAAFPFDHRVGAALDVMTNSSWKECAHWYSKIGEGWVPAVIGVFLAAVYLVLNRPQVAAKIFFVTLTCELTGLAVVILRLIFGRARPNNHDVPPGFYGLWHDGHWILGQFKFSSFPSGHAATAVGVAAAAWLVHRGWGAVLMVYALAVMWSRIALQCHHLSDVLASTVLSIALAVWLKPRLLPSLEFQFGNLHRALRKKKF
jgi:membrane-associated phospholipid phosphatase